MWGDVVIRKTMTKARMATEDPTLYAMEVGEALSRMGLSQAVPYLLVRLKSNDEIIRIQTINDIANLGKAGNAAGRELLKHLWNDNWDLRIHTACALGAIGYKKATPQLLKALNFIDDWRLNYAAAIGLGKLGMAKAVPDLYNVAATHWYLPVREVARKMVDSNSGLLVPLECNDIIFSYEKAASDTGRKLPCWPGSSASKAASKLNIKDGTLVGTDNGEFGGGLMFEGKHGRKYQISQANTKAVARIGSKIIAVMGLAHLGSDNGSVREVSRVHESWTLVRRVVLPGAPLEVNQLSDKELLIRTYGGTIVLSSDLSLRLIECQKNEMPNDSTPR